MRTAAATLSILVAILVGLSAAPSADTIGVVLLHGKTGMPGQMSKLSEALIAAGYKVATPELCWSRRRIFDKTLDDCLVEVDAAADRLKAAGATTLVVGGASQGAMAAVVYGASRKGLSGIIAIVPAGDPVDLTKYPGLAGAVGTARRLVKSGQGDQQSQMVDLVSGGKEITITTTPNIYMSFHATDAPIATLQNLIAKTLPRLSAPLLWVAASDDPSQAIAPKGFAAAPKTSASRLVTLKTDHAGAPDASVDTVLAWLKSLP